MHRRPRILLSLASAVGMVGALALPVQPMRAAAPGAGECTPLVSSLAAGVVTCYRPTHIALAEHLMPARPVNPVAAVHTVASVPLTQVLVVHGTIGHAHGNTAILYVFGTPNHMTCPPGARCPRIPGYVIVQETVGHVKVKGMRLSQDRSAMWHLVASMPGRNLFLAITSNAPKQFALAMGKRILQAAT